MYHRANRSFAVGVLRSLMASDDPVWREALRSLTRGDAGEDYREDLVIHLSDTSQKTFSVAANETWDDIKGKVVEAFGLSVDLDWCVTFGNCLVDDDDPFATVMGTLHWDNGCRLHHNATITFRKIDGSSLSLDLWTYEIMWDIKERIKQKLDNYCCCLHLMIGSVEIGNEQSLWSCGMSNGGVMDVVLSEGWPSQSASFAQTYSEYHEFDDHRTWPW